MGSIISHPRRALLALPLHQDIYRRHPPYVVVAGNSYWRVVIQGAGYVASAAVVLSAVVVVVRVASVVAVVAVTTVVQGGIADPFLLPVSGRALFPEQAVSLIVQLNAL